MLTTLMKPLRRAAQALPTRRNAVSESVHFLRSYFSDEPSYAIFFVTAVCNARCSHCFYWEEIGSAKASRELKLPEIQKIADGLDLIYLSIGGGEPFIRKDLPEIVQAFYERSGILYCNIVTNGWYTEKTVEAVRRILETCPRLRLKIQVSFDDFEEAHDENRKVKGIYRKALETTKRLSDEFRANNPRFTLDVATCLTRSNKGHATDLVDHLRAEAAFDNFSFLYPRGNAEVAEEKDVTPAEYREAIRYLEGTEFRTNHNSILGAVHRVARRGILSVIERDAFPWPCLGGKKFINITETGVVQPCEVLSQMLPERDTDLGDLRAHDYDVRAVMQTPQAESVREFIRDSKCRCSFECAAMNNVVFDRRNASQVIRTWLTGTPGGAPW